MNVTETPLKGDIVPLPKSAQKKYPTTIKMLPQNFHVSAFCGARSSGKSWKCCQLLYLYQLHGYTDPTNGDKCCQRIILISPTYLANEHLFKPLKHLAPDDIHQTYSEQLLQDIIANIKEEADATEKYLEEKAMLKKISKVRRIEDLTEEMLEFLEWYDGNLPEPKYKTRCVTHLVLDDLAGSGCYTNKSKSALTNRVILNRHIRTNFYILVQSCKAIPKTIRNNVSVWYLYRFCNTKMVLDDLYIEVSRLVTEDQFTALYDYATTPDHGVLIVDLTGGIPKELRFRSDFNKSLSC